MKNPLLTRSALVVGTLLCIGDVIPVGAAAQDPPPKAVDPKTLLLTLSAGSLSLNGQEFTLPVPVQEIINVLGKPTRESRLANTILTWDELGIYIYLDPGSAQAKEIHVDFRKERVDFAPKKVFAGRVVIDKTEVTADSTTGQIDAARRTLQGLIVEPHPDEQKRIVCLSIFPSGLSESTGGPAKGATTGPRARPTMVAGADPPDQLVGGWSLDGFVVGGGGVGFSGLTFDKITVAPPSDGAVSVSASSKEGDDYSFLLTHGPETNAYLIAVKSGHGINVDNFLLRYIHGEGWRGTLDQLVDGEMLSTTASIIPIEGRNWYGWRIQVLPTAAIDLAPEELKKPYLMVDLTRRK
jgi:hypothetical protein